jgi:hypothetical protein
MKNKYDYQQLQNTPRSPNSVILLRITFGGNENVMEGGMFRKLTQSS